MVLAQIFLYGCLAMLAGIGAASLIDVSLFLFWLAAVVAAVLFLSGLAVKKHRVTVLGILLMSFIFGFWRFAMVWRAGMNNGLAQMNGKTVEISGIVAADPVFNRSSQQIIVRPDNIGGKILVNLRSYPEFAYGDRIGFTAAIEAPQNFNGFDYRNYLAKDGIYSIARYPDIKLISRNNGNPIFGGLLWVKHRLKEGVGRSLPAPQNSLLVAILLGDQSGLDGCTAKELEADPDCSKLKEKLNVSGLRHLSAVSGAHITIIAAILAPFFVALGFWRQKALWLTLVFVWSFILMIGLPASAVRAGIMGSLMILAQIIGRPADTARIVAIAAAFMAMENPMLLRFDIGFQLSFLAVLGMVYFARPIEKRIIFIPGPIREPLAITFAALISTLPLLVYDFGYVPIYAPIANLLVEPLVPFITIYGFILAIGGAISAALGWLLFFPIWLALSYLLFVAELFSGLPYSAALFEINFLWLAISYVILAVIARKIKQNEELSFLGK